MSSISVLSRSFKTFPWTRSGYGAAIEAIRNFHTSKVRLDLVAPPDPVSHMRPILYEDRPSQRPPPAYLRHPYSLSEFKEGPGNSIGDHELQFKLLRQQLDTLHQSFWLDSNTRFYAAKQAILSSLPATATARDKEDTLSAFHKQWVMQEKDCTDSYTAEWRRRNLQLIALGARVEFHRLKTRLSNFFKRTTPSQ